MLHANGLCHRKLFTIISISPLGLSICTQWPALGSTWIFVLPLCSSCICICAVSVGPHSLCPTFSLSVLPCCLCQHMLYFCVFSTIYIWLLLSSGELQDVSAFRAEACMMFVEKLLEGKIDTPLVIPTLLQQHNLSVSESCPLSTCRIAPHEVHSL